MIAPLCAFCIDSPATTTAEWTDATRGTSRIVHACAECALQAIPEEKPDGAGRSNPTTSQRAVFIEALRRIGPSTIGDVAKAANSTLDSTRNNLSGLVLAGVAIAEPSPPRGRGGRRPLLYRLKESTP